MVHDGVLPGSKLREIRVERGVTALAIAAWLGVSPSYVSMVENGRKNPTLAWGRTYLQGVEELAEGVHAFDVRLRVTIDVDDGREWVRIHEAVIE